MEDVREEVRGDSSSSDVADAGKACDASADSRVRSRLTSTDHDPFAYLDGNDFRSENFKMEIRNLPKYYGLSELKKLLNNKLKLGTVKIRTLSRGSCRIHVFFRSEEDRKQAIEVLNGYRWKGSVLTAEAAKAVPHPSMRKRIRERSDGSGKKSKIDDRCLVERLKDAVTPLWRLPYEEQLLRKMRTIREILKYLGNELVKVNPNASDRIKSQQEKHGGLPCEVWPFRHPELVTSDGYRNKCDFSIGINEATGAKTVGFRLGAYAATGSASVAPIDEAVNVPKRMKDVVSVFEKYVRDSDYDVFRPETQKGYWRQLTLRYGFRTDEIMLVIGLHPQKLDKRRLRSLFDDVTEFFVAGPGKTCNATSLFVRLVAEKCHDEEPHYHHLLGETHIRERILNREFRISPRAFFQINAAAAEVLYESIAELANLDRSVSLLDICCGTGSIGICLSQKCGEILGLEVSPQAVEEAKRNAEANDVDNARFFVGKAEDILTSVTFRATNESVVAVADPPRAGLHQNAVAHLRKAPNIDKLVYVSQEPRLALKNFVALGRATSKMYRREAFLPVKAVPVDLFPHTSHCELLVCFERVRESATPRRKLANESNS